MFFSHQFHTIDGLDLEVCVLLANQSLSEKTLKNFKSLAGRVWAASPVFSVCVCLFFFSPKKGFDIKSRKPKFRGKEICTESHRELHFTAIPCKCHVAIHVCLCVCVSLCLQHLLPRNNNNNNYSSHHLWWFPVVGAL